MALDRAAVQAKVTQLAAGFSTKQKVLMGAAVAGVVVALFLVARMGASSAAMAPLFTDLAPADAASVTEELTGKGVSYELADGGQSVMVPRSQLYDLRLSMAAQGLPSNGSQGYALLDEQGITTSEFAQQVGYQRALEGELARTIQALEVVEAANVHLVVPKEQVFATDRREASASVLVRARPGKQLDPGQVQAVVHLVASSVPGLTPEQVTVADATGMVLAAPGQTVGGAAGSLLTRQRQEFEKAVASSVENLIVPVVGSGKAKVTVNADLDFDERTSTTEHFAQPSGDPAVPTRGSEVIRSEEYAGVSASDAGILGAQPLAAAGGDTEYTLTETESQFLVDRTVETVNAAPGAIRRLSVGVVVDSATASAEEANQIRDLVAAAAGINTGRGDVVQVSRLAFDTSVADAQAQALTDAESARRRDDLLSLVRQVGIVLLVAIVLYLVWRNVRRASDRTPVVETLDVREIEARVMEVPEPDEALEPALVAAAPLPEAPSEEETHRQQVSAEVAQMIDQQPAEVAQLLRGWLGERPGRRR